MVRLNIIKDSEYAVVEFPTLTLKTLSGTGVGFIIIPKEGYPSRIAFTDLSNGLQIYQDGFISHET